MSERTNYTVRVRAGPKGESSPTFQYVESPIPRGVKSPGEEPYRAISQAALKAAEKIARQTGKNLTLKLDVKLR